MNRLRFFGRNRDEFLCYQGDDLLVACGCGGPFPNTYLFEVKDEESANGMMVIGSFLPSVTGADCWIVGVAQLDEDIPLPSWPVKYDTASSGRSPVLIVEASAKAVVE